MSESIAPFDAYLFDLDGTLVDTAPDLMYALNQTLEHADFERVDLEATRHWVGHGAKVMLDQAIKDQSGTTLSKDELAKLYEIFLVHYRSHISQDSEPYCGVVATLEKLMVRTRKLGVVTNKRQDLSMQLLRELDLYRFFNIVVGGDTLQVSKPEPQPLLYACNELVSTPEGTLFVGDSITDVSAARNAGCPVVCLRDGYNHNTPAEQLGADWVIDSFYELL